MNPCRDQDCPKPHCICCSTRHPDTGDQTCIHCLGQTRRELRAIPVLAAAIAADLTGYPHRSPGTPSGGEGGWHGTKEQPMPGGERLNLIGPTGDGRNSGGHDHQVDNDRDEPAALATLEGWEREWRETRHMRAAQSRADFGNVCGWLSDNLGWAAQHHPAFDEFHRDVHQLHRTLEVAAIGTQRPVVGSVMCLQCPGVRLMRSWLTTGLDDVWHCPRCRRRYTDAEYWLAVRSAHEAAQGLVS